MSESMKTSRADFIRRKFRLKGSESVDGQWREELKRCADRTVPLLTLGTITLVHGASGSGKSMLLREIAERLGRRASVAHDHAMPDTLVIDALHWMEVEDALELLCRFGLGEAHCYLRPVAQLSTGQQFRLKLAMALARAQTSTGTGGVLVVDEFATQLDRISAAVIARNFRRAIDGSGAAAVVATCHDHVVRALRPEAEIGCDFGEFAIQGHQHAA